jgi:ribonuclease Z
VLLDEPRFRVRAAFLDHGIPCLGFALEEKARVNVWKNRLAEMGLETGPWLNELKRAVAEGLPDDTRIQGWPLGELKARALAIAPGQKICYITDIRYHAENEARAARLAADADLLFIESVFLSLQADHAARKLLGRRLRNALTAIRRRLRKEFLPDARRGVRRCLEGGVA